MKFVFVSSPTFECWDWTNPDVQGIGGSETSHIEMSNRLSRRGHQVHSYAPTSFDGPALSPSGVTWESCGRAKWQEGLWILYRNPEVIDDLPPGVPAWLICQDVDYSKLTEQRAARLTRIVGLCETHGKYLRARYPFAADKVFVSSNGVKVDQIREMLIDPPARNPKRLMYASSPDRGLLYLAQIFERAREVVPDLELHIYYGFNNLDKIIQANPQFREGTERLRRLLEQPGIEYHGRMGQRELFREWLKTGIWCHPSSFTETSCITCMDAQALGAIPITTPVWAVGENVEHGVLIEGDPYNCNATRARYTLELIRMACDPNRQQAIREKMMPWALERFDWERYVMQWEDWAGTDIFALQSSCEREVAV